jgi:hypothetical protein
LREKAAGKYEMSILNGTDRNQFSILSLIQCMVV